MNEDVQYASLELARVKMFLDITMDRLHNSEESLTSMAHSFLLLKRKYDIDIKLHASSLMSEIRERASEMTRSIQEGHDEILSQIHENFLAALKETQSHCLRMQHSDSSQQAMLMRLEEIRKNSRDGCSTTAKLQEIVQSIRNEFTCTLKDSLEELQVAYELDRNKALAELEELLKNIKDGVY